MHTEQGVEIESISSGMTEDSEMSCFSEPEAMGSSPTNGVDVIPTNSMDLIKNLELNFNDIASTLPYVLLETPSPITEELPFSIGPETPEKCQNAAVFQTMQEDTESDWDTESDSFSIYARRPLTREEIRARKRNAFLKFACGLLFGLSAVLVLCVLLVKWIHEFNQRKEDELIMISLVFLSFGLWSLFLLFIFQFLFVCPTNCEFADEDVV